MTTHKALALDFSATHHRFILLCQSQLFKNDKQNEGEMQMGHVAWRAYSELALALVAIPRFAQDALGLCHCTRKKRNVHFFSTRGIL